jgi:hypothetical protein
VDTSLLVALVGLGGGLLGSALGGMISYFSTSAVRKLEWRQSLAVSDVTEREQIYSEFVAEAGRLVLLSLSEDAHSTKSSEFSKLVALESRIWFHSEAVCHDARVVAKAVMREFPSTSKAPDSGSTSKEGQLKYSEARDKFLSSCRAELKGLRAIA